jgi:predicted  nucleic acid-binding Zn-ribbon protein
MQLSNCVVCGKIFRHEEIVARRCPDCETENEQILRRTKDLIIEHPGLTVQELSEKSGLPYRQIMEWIREGRILR